MAGREGGKTICCLTVHVRVCESLRLSSDDVEASPLAENSFFVLFFFLRYRLKWNVSQRLS